MPRLELKHIHKQFGVQYALRDVTLDVEAGEVLALVGENGAGKSTLVKILSGALQRDTGEISLDGNSFRPRNPLEARQAGIAMVYQELALAPHLSVADNIMLGMESHRWGWLSAGAQNHKVRNALAILEHSELDPVTPVSRLKPGLRQLVEIARALANEARVIIFDEPTSSLTQEDARRLFGIIDRLKQSGLSVIYISHFLEEIQRVADRYTVLRNGESVATGMVRDTPTSRIIEQMIGRPVGELNPRQEHSIGEAVLQVQSLQGDPLPEQASLTLLRGEIYGIFGLVGSGRTELLRRLYGLEPASVRELKLNHLSIQKIDTHQRLRSGLGLLSEDRKHEGLSIHQSLEENLTLSHLSPYTRWGWLDWSWRRHSAGDWLHRFHVKHRSAAQSATELSGGNQQKLALARLFHQQADVLLLDEPTKGVDIGSKQEIYRLIGEQAALGKSFIIVSSHLPELLGICDTISVMVRGKLGSKRPVADCTAHELMTEATASS